MKTERFAFPGHDGATRHGALDLPAGPIRATALFAHCFACTPDAAPARRIATRLTEAGLAVLRLDFTGLDAGTPALEVSDLHAAAQALAERGLPPRLMIGHSLAGTAVLKAAAQLDTVQAVATLGAPAAPAKQNFAARLVQGLENGLSEVNLGRQKFSVSKTFLDDIATPELTASIHNLHAALLVMHAPLDQSVGIANATEIFTAAKHPKSFITLGDADHLLSRPEDANYAATMIAAWAGRDLEPEHPAPGAMPTPQNPAPDGAVRVRELDPDGFLSEVANGPDHWLLADEPTTVGGTNKGPSPYAFLKAALGACTSMTIRMYARLKKWPLTGISVDVTHRKIPDPTGAKDPRGRPLKRDVFTRRITLDGDLTPDQRARLTEIADRCPVHKTLHQASEIVTETAE